MNKDLILEAAQLHGDIAFMQGALAVMFNYDLSDRYLLSQMKLAVLRIFAFQILWDAMKDEHTNIKGLAACTHQH